MRWLLLLGIIALATVARAEEKVVQDEEVDLLESVDEDSRIDVSRMLSDLFDFNDEDDAEHDGEVGVDREARAKGEESAVEQRAAVEPDDQARYNKFMDTFFRRLNADARTTIDPLEVPLVTRKAKKGATKKGDAKKGKKGDVKKGKRKNNKIGNKNKGGNKKKGSNKNTNNKNKKKGRHPKNLNLDEVEVEDESDGVVAVAEEEVHHVVTRDAEHVKEIEKEDEDEEEVLERHVRSLEAVDEDENDVDSAAAVSRSIKPKSNKKNKSKKNNKKGRKKNGGNKKKGNKSKRSANKNKDNKNKGKSSKGKSSRPKTSRASVSGIASLTRIGDVSVVDRKDGKELRTEFKIGPVNLKVNRSFGKGKDAVVRSATAESPELTGKMHLSVAANGKAKITKFNISRPSVVTTSGNLNKDGARFDKNTFMEKSIARITPMAAKKLKLAARDVLQATNSNN